MKLAGKIAYITGADSGIGQAMAKLFAEEGADVAIGYHTDEAGARETAGQVEAAGRRAQVLQVDVGEQDSVEAFFAAAAKTLGTSDVFVANAGLGMGEPKQVAEMDGQVLDSILQTDLKGPLFCARTFVRLRRAAGGGGRFLITGSVAGHLPTPNSAPYGMAKAGVNSLVRSLSVEVAPDHINVNAIAPGLIATPMTQKRLDNLAEREKSMAAIPWKRPGRPEEIAGLALFLAADSGDYVTGQTWTMDGGLTMHWGGA